MRGAQTAEGRRSGLCGTCRRACGLTLVHCTGCIRDADLTHGNAAMRAGGRLVRKSAGPHDLRHEYGWAVSAALVLEQYLMARSICRMTPNFGGAGRRHGKDGGCAARGHCGRESTKLRIAQKIRSSAQKPRRTDNSAHSVCRALRNKSPTRVVSARMPVRTCRVRMLLQTLLSLRRTC